MKNWRVKLFGVLAVAVSFCTVALGQKALAAEDKSVKVTSEVETSSGRVFYDTDHLYTMHGTKGGQTWSDTTASLAVQYPDGHNEMVFCVAPGVPLVGGMWTDGYEGIESDAVDREAMIAASIWQDVFPSKTQHEEITARAVVWGYLKAYDLDITSIDGIPEFPQLKKKLQDAVDNYKKVPAFNKQTVKLTYGQTTKIDSGGVDLRAFDGIQTNSADVKFEISSDGMSANVTPTDPAKVDGKYQAVKTTMWGTPIIWTHDNSQTVVTPHISDPAAYTVTWDIDALGHFQVKKVDKESGEAVPGTKFKLEYSNLPAKFDVPKEVTTDKNGLSPKIEVPDGVHVKATEISVPKPYILGSSIGEKDVIEGDITAGETITLTVKNVKETGQIIIEKSGKESKKELWNDKYSLAGNVFEIRENDKDGKVVKTITSDAEGVAKSSDHLALGTYYISEKTAANGFSNTFKPVTVKIEYKDQKTPIVVENEKGTNQEVVGSTLLTKEDAETKAGTQGRATFDGATYGLFHEDGTPVKWSDNFKPVTSKGNKLEGEEIKFELSDKEQQASVEHLALGTYFWKELVAPEGYQLDNTKREFSVTYKDQDTKVIETQSTSKENVIKFSLDGFKYVDSKSGDVKSGYNGIEFALNPIDPTKGEERKVTTETDANGYDGYWAFNEVPYGDYKMSEVKAPEGYKKIKDLIINSKFDKEKREYTVTITEDGQNEAIKTLTVPESKINEGSNLISLGKLMLTNNLVKAPEISTKASVDGKQAFKPAKETPMKDTINLSGLNKDSKYRLKAIKLWRIQGDDKENATVVYEAEEDFIAEKETMEKVVETLVDTSKDDENTRYVWTEKLAELDDEGNENEVADHEDLDNKEQTAKPEIPEKPEEPKEEPKIETLFITTDGKQEIDATKDQKLIDKVSQDFPESQIGKTKYWVHKLHKVSDTNDKAIPTSSTSTTDSETTETSSTDSKAAAEATTNDGNSTVLETIKDTRKVTKGNEEFTVDFQYYAKKYNLKEGEKLVVTHEVFNDEEHTDKYAEHFDLNNEKQTIRPKKVEAETPTTPTPTPEKSIPQTGSYSAFREFFSSIYK